MLALLFGVVSLLYATVGQAGGTAFLAVMAVASFNASEMRPTALILNIVAATYSTWFFSRGRIIDWPLLRPYLLASLPTALVGGFIVLPAGVYEVVTGTALLIAAVLLIFKAAVDVVAPNPAPPALALATGATVGLVSGLTGVGGGVFLAPFLIWMHWASPRQTAALSAPFILANSMMGLVGTLYAGQMPRPDTWLFALACTFGAAAGTAIGVRWLSQRNTRFILAVILGVAGVQLLLH